MKAGTCQTVLRQLVLIIFLATVISGCTFAQLHSTATPAPTRAVVTPTDKPNSVPMTPTIAREPTSTPEIISTATLGRVVPLKLLGKGTITNPVEFSPNGSVFAVPTSTGVFVYDSQTLEEITQLRTGRLVTNLDFSPDGNQLAVGTTSDRIQIWDVFTKELITEIHLSNNDSIFIYQLDYSPDGSLLAASYGPNDVIDIFSLKDFALKYNFPGYKFSFAPNSNLLTTTGPSGENPNIHPVYLFDLNDGSEINRWQGRYGIFTTNGQLAIQRTEAVQVLDIKNDTAMQPITTSISAFSMDGQRVAIFSPNAVIVKELKGIKPQVAMAGEYTLVEGLQFSANGRFLVGLVTSRPVGCCVGGPDKLVVWNVVDGSVQLTLDLLEYSRNATFSPNGEQLLITDTDRINIINLADGKVINKNDGFSNQIQGIAFSPDGQKLAATYLGTRSVRIWQIADGQIEKMLQDPDNSNLGTPSTISYSPDGRILFASGRFWEIASGNRIAELESRVPENLPVISALSFNPKPFQLVAGFADGSLRFWNLVDNQLIHELHPADGEVVDVAFSTDGRLVSVIHAYPAFSLQVWENQQDYPRVLHLRDKFYRQAVFSPDVRTMAVLAASRDIDYEVNPPGSIQIWDLVKRVMTSEWNGENIMRIAFSPDGSLLAGGLSDQGAVQVWDPKNGELLATLHGHVSRVIDVEFSPDGSLLASASEDGTIVLWGIPPR